MASEEGPEAQGLATDVTGNTEENSHDNSNAQSVTFADGTLDDNDNPEAGDDVNNSQADVSQEDTTRPITQGSSRPESKRIPTISARAAFTRTPSHRLAAGQEYDGLPTQEETGILITELQASFEEEEEDEDVVGGETDVADGGAADMEALQLPPEDEDLMKTVELKLGDDDYDTDLENLGDEEDEDATVSYYKSVCDELGVVPVAYFLRHMRDPEIRMRYRGLGPDPTRAIALALRDSITLEKLDLGGNWMEAEGARFMSRLLEENDYITEMGMSENKITNEGATFVCNMVKLNGGLRKLDISGNEFDDKSAQDFAEAIETNKYLRDLNLSHNRFSECGGELLGPAISANENLEVLDLSWNHLRQKGGIAVAKGLKDNVRLKVCNLSWNGLDVAGGIAVADAMMSNQSLLELDMSGNRLNLEVANKMAKVLTVNDTIRVLRMGNNLITSAGAIALASAINNTANCEMEELDLTDVPVEFEFLRTIEDIKTMRPNFKVIHGPIMRAGNTIADLDKPAIDVYKHKKEPIVVLKEHIVVNDMRLFDVLKKYDADGNLQVSAEDFITALDELALPYNKPKVQEAVTQFAEKSIGKIYFGDFIGDEYERMRVVKKTTKVTDE